MSRFTRTVVYSLLFVMTLSASDWPYFDEIVEDLGSQLQPATMNPSDESASSERRETTPPGQGQHGLYYQLLLVMQGVLPTNLQILRVAVGSTVPQASVAVFRSEPPEGLYRPPIFTPIA